MLIALGMVAAGCVDAPAPDPISSNTAHDVRKTLPLPNCAFLGHVFNCSVNGQQFDRQCMCPNTSAALLQTAFLDGGTGCLEAGGSIVDTLTGWPGTGGETNCNVCNPFGQAPPTCQ